MNNGDDCCSVPYDRFLRFRKEAVARHGELLELPVRGSAHGCLRMLYVREYPGGRVLDFGCGANKPLQQVLGIDDDRYHTCDSDAAGAFTYAAADEISEDETYDMVAANQVFEHLEFEEGVRTARRLARHVAPGGIFEIDVPNPQHPTRQWADPTHRTPWNYPSVYALLALGGLDPFICARTGKVLGIPWWQRPLVNTMCRVFRMDWCDTVYVVARRPKEGEEPHVESE
jgi:SAM-dependent methyltransferase